MTKLIIAASALLALMGAGCTADISWHFPIQFGDLEERVQTIAGVSEYSPDPENKTQWYPQSGFTITYDDYKKVTRISFPNLNNPSDWTRYKQDIFGSINTLSTYQDFQKQLGEPYENIHNEEFDDHYTAKWHTENFRIEADFIYADYTEDSITYKKDSLNYLSLIRAL